MNIVLANGNHVGRFLDQIYSVPSIKDYSFTAQLYEEKFRVLYSFDKLDEKIEIKSIDGHTLVEDFYNDSFLNMIEDKIWEDLKCNR